MLFYSPPPSQNIPYPNSPWNHPPHGEGDIHLGENWKTSCPHHTPTQRVVSLESAADWAAPGRRSPCCEQGPHAGEAHPSRTRPYKPRYPVSSLLRPQRLDLSGQPWEEGTGQDFVPRLLPLCMACTAHGPAGRPSPSGLRQSAAAAAPQNKSSTAQKGSEAGWLPKGVIPSGTVRSGRQAAGSSRLPLLPILRVTAQLSPPPTVHKITKRLPTLGACSWHSPAGLREHFQYRQGYC